MDGAEELDMVINVGMIKSGDWDYVRRDIEAVVRRADKAAIVKVILETCLLTDEEKRSWAGSAGRGRGFVKTSTGFSSGGAGRGR